MNPAKKLRKENKPSAKEISWVNEDTLVINRSLSTLSDSLGKTYDDIKLDGTIYRIRQHGNEYDVQRVATNKSGLMLLPVTSETTKKVLDAYKELKNSGE